MKKAASIILCILMLLQIACVPVFASDGTVGDPMVYLTQKWLNQNYGDIEGFGSVTENGKTGWDTIYGLTRALQHELGITELANSFGPKTKELYSQNPLKRQDGVTDKKFAILQGALWCKGYNPGYKLTDQNGTAVFEEVFDDQVEQAIIQLKTDAGFISPDGVVTTEVMKALLSMDSFKLITAGGTHEIRDLQQHINREYSDYTGIIACDGIYSRSTAKALIYALQAEEGLPTNVANGNFGSTTKKCCPTIPYERNENAARSYTGQYYTDTQIAAFTKILDYALLVNGHNDIASFQKEMALEVTGKADLTTWLSLLTSCGDTSRPALAADCATILTKQKAKTLYENGYRYIGRYLTVSSKAITRQEAEIIFDAGLSFFPIYQTSANYPEYFTPERAATDAKAAVEAATKLGLPKDTVIYFAVDFDCMDYQITSGVMPYFKKLSEDMAYSGFKIGVYGSRNLCTRISEAGYSCSSFVGDMSTGYSGNLGFKMPKNWAFDQFATVTIGSGEGKLEIDKNGYSGRDKGVSKLMPEVVLKDTAKMFEDISKDAWYKQYTDYAVSYGIFSGTSDTTFSPNADMTRAQFAQVLANLSGAKLDNNVKTGFTDAPSGKWFTGAVKWAVDNKVASGTGAGRFDPTGKIDRQQMCVMLVNYVEKYKKSELKKEIKATTFADDFEIANWAKTAVYKCADAKLVNGVGAGKFAPKTVANRATGATIFTNFHKEYIA